MERLNSITFENLQKGAEVPNAPFLYLPSRGFVLKEARDLGYKDINERENPSKAGELEYAYDRLATYIHIKKGESQTRTIITSHLDHPFIVLDGHGNGQTLGTIGSERLKKLVANASLPLRVYSSEGNYQTNDFVKTVKGQGGKTTVTTEHRDSYLNNSHGIWNIEPLIEEGDNLKLINADNMVSNAILLTLMRDFSNYQGELPIDVEFIFSNVEEVRQISATGIAKRRETPFGRIDSNTNIYVLESASVNSPDDQLKVMDKLGLAPANYEDGVVLRINDGGLLYGQNGKGQNRAENLLLHSAEEVGINYQQTVLDGVCEGTPYTIFSDTPNIAGIDVPTLHKHNWGRDGEIAHEVVKKGDVQSALDLTRQVILNSSMSEKLTMDERVLTQKLLNTSVAASPKEIQDLRANRESAFYANSYRLNQGIFYPRQFEDRFYMFLGSVMRRMTA